MAMVQGHPQLHRENQTSHGHTHGSWQEERGKGKGEFIFLFCCKENRLEFVFQYVEILSIHELHLRLK